MATNKYIFSNEFKIRNPRYGCQIEYPSDTVYYENIDNYTHVARNGTYDRLYPCFIINNVTPNYVISNGSKMKTFESNIDEIEYGRTSGNNPAIQLKEYNLIQSNAVLPILPEYIQLTEDNGFSICISSYEILEKLAIPLTAETFANPSTLTPKYFYKELDGESSNIFEAVVENNTVILKFVNPDEYNNIFYARIYSKIENVPVLEEVEEGRSFDYDDIDRDTINCWNISIF